MAEGFDGGAVGAVAGGVGGAEEGEAGFSEGGGEVEGAAIEAEDGGGAVGGIDKAGEAGDVLGEGGFDGGGEVENELVAGIAEERGELFVVFEGPLFGAPSGEGAGEDEGRIGELTFGGTGREGGVDDALLGAGGGGEVEIPVDDVGGAWGDLLGVEGGGGAFAEERGGKAEAARGAGGAGEEGGLDEALDVDGDIDFVGAEVMPGGAEAGRGATVDGEDVVDVGIGVEEPLPFGVDGPGEACAGDGAAQGGGGGEGVEDIAESAEADEEDVGAASHFGGCGRGR